MNDPITSLDALLDALRGRPPRRVAVAAGHDPHTIAAAARAAGEGIAAMVLVGDAARIHTLCDEHGIDAALFEIVPEDDTAAAGRRARDMVRAGDADVLMKGLIGTADYMRLILDREHGLLPPGALLTHATVFELPAYRRRHGKLLLGGDVAIIPAPTLEQKRSILRSLVDAAHRFGLDRPRVAVLAASEKVSERMPATVEAAALRDEAPEMFPDALVDGPLALDVALSPEACAIKGLDSPLGGAADVLLFPNIESGNVFYKAATLLAGARLAAAVVGTTAPCVLTSRADAEESKFLSIALGCRLAGDA